MRKVALIIDRHTAISSISEDAFIGGVDLVKKQGFDTKGTESAFVQITDIKSLDPERETYTFNGRYRISGFIKRFSHPDGEEIFQFSGDKFYFDKRPKHFVGEVEISEVA